MSAATLAQRLNKTKEEAQQIFDTFFKEFPKVKKLVDFSQHFLKKNGYVEDWAGRRRHLPDISLKPYEVKLAKQTANSQFNPFLECSDRETKDPRVLKWEKAVKEQIAKTNAFKRSKDPNWKDEEEMSNKAYDELAKQALKDGVIIQANTGRIAQADRQCLNARIQGGAASLTKLAMIAITKDKRMQELGVKIICPVHDEILVTCAALYADEVKKLLPKVMIDTAQKYLPSEMRWKCDPYEVFAWYQDNYSAAIIDEFEKLKAKGVPEDQALQKVIDNHIETPKQLIIDCIKQNKEIDFEFVDN